MADCFMMIGNAQFQAELIQEAIESYKSSYSYSETLQIRHCLAKAYLKSGHELHKSGKYKQACNEFQRGLSYQPDNTKLQAGLAFSGAAEKAKTADNGIQCRLCWSDNRNFDWIVSLLRPKRVGSGMQPSCLNFASKGVSIATMKETYFGHDFSRYGSYNLQIEKEGYAPIKEEVNPGFGRGAKRIKI